MLNKEVLNKPQNFSKNCIKYQNIAKIHFFLQLSVDNRQARVSISVRKPKDD